MSNIFKFNSHQTPLTQELIKSLPTEVYSNLLEYIDTIEFVANLIDPNIKRVKDLPKDEEGKIVVDITIPHVLEDMDYFRAAALHFQKYGRYTLLTENPHPKSPYRLFWKEEKRRCLEGHVRPDGEWIPGDLYFYWNYCPIMLTKQLGDTKKALRIKDFPKPWLGDYLFFHYKDQADKAGKHIAMIKMRGVGAAGPDSEPVMTPDGWRTYGDINEGDLLIDRTGKPTKVLEVYPQGLSDIYEISFHDGRKVRCTNNHRWSVLDKRNCSNYKDRVLTTEEMINIGLYREFKNNKSYNFYVPDIEPIEFTEKELTVPPYTLGYLLGDGSMNGTNLRVATNDTEVLDYILDELDDSYYFTPDKSNNNYNLNSHNRFKATKEDKKKYKNSQYGFNKIKREVELLNLNVTTGHKFIPSVYKKASIHQRLELLKGLMDADGSISKDGGMEFANSNYTLIKDVEELCRSLGIKCKLGKGRSPRKKVIKGKECNIKQEYRLYIQTANYIPFKIKRKINRFNPNKKVFKGTSIVGIKKLDYKENARCFLVDNEEHLYLTTDFIPTHNSFKAGSLGVLRAVLRKNQKTFYTAYDKQFLNQDGVLNKSWAYLDFLAENTPFPRMRLKDSLNRMELRMGYKDLDTNAEKGSKGEIIGISSKDDPDKIRGKRGTIYFEEFGKFPKLSDTWNVCRDSTEDGEVAYDMLIAMGCVCAGTKVWTKEGRYVNIEELKQSDGILGFNVDEEHLSPQTISWMQPPAEKECVEINTKYRQLRCSLDHPILVRTEQEYKTDVPNGIRRDYYKKLDKWYETVRYKKKIVYKKQWKNAGDIEVGDVVLISEGVDFWGDVTLFDARLVGMLIGDGSYGMRRHYGKLEYKTPSFSNCDEELNTYVENNYPHTVCLQRPTKDGLRIYKEISIRGLIPKLKEIGIAGQSKAQKRLPSKYMDLTKKDAALLLAGLFDTDGHVCIRPSKSPSTVGLTQSSEEMLIQVKELLEKFGITSIIRKQMPNLKKTKGILDRNPWYTLTISNKKSLRNFHKNIPLLIQYKKERLEKIVEITYLKEIRKNNTFKNMLEERVCEVKKIGKHSIYNLTALEDNTYLANNIITHNTGGTEGADFQGAEDMIYNPDTYNILPIRNVFDKNASDGKVCFHWGSYLNRNLCYDENGNPDVIKALLEVLTEFNNIKQTSSDSKALTQRRAEKCITIQDAVMRTEGTLFPVVDLKDYLAEIRTQGIRFFEKHYIVDLVFSGGEVKHTLTDKYPLRKYKYDPKDKEGAIEIFELPKKGVDGKPMRGRYIAGIDPYDDDEGVSLGSIIIFDLINDVIVAEYTGRPKFANDFYEICRRLCMFYNAEALYENNKKGLFTYFVQQGSVYLLADAPQTLVDQHMMKAHFNNNKRKGVHATNEINRRARMLQNDWMITSANPAYQDYDEEGNLASNKLNMHLIRSTAYLEEAIAWNPDGNFDRISSMGMVMLLREEKKQYLDNIKTNNSPTKSLAEDEYFTKEFDERFSYYEEDSYN